MISVRSPIVVRNPSHCPIHTAGATCACGGDGGYGYTRPDRTGAAACDEGVAGLLQPVHDTAPPLTFAGDQRVEQVGFLVDDGERAHDGGRHVALVPLHGELLEGGLDVRRRGWTVEHDGPVDVDVDRCWRRPG